MLTEQDFENICIGDVVEVEPIWDHEDTEEIFLNQLCRCNYENYYTGKVIGCGIDSEHGTRNVYLEFDNACVDAHKFGIDGENIEADEAIEFADNIKHGTQYFAIGLDVVSCMKVISKAGVSRVDNSEEDRGGLHLI